MNWSSLPADITKLIEIVDLPIKNGDFPVRYGSVDQQFSIYWGSTILWSAVDLSQDLQLYEPIGIPVALTMPATCPTLRHLLGLYVSYRKYPHILKIPVRTRVFPMFLLVFSP